VIDLVASN